jgi:ubiquitin-protein ligase
MSTVRLRRLQADYDKLREFLLKQPRIRLIQAEGAPPERYQLEYQIRSLRQVDEQLMTSNSHMVEISLPLSYPRMPPQCRMLTPIFHPNIAPHAICIGDHWSPGEPLCSMVTRIGEMIAYQSYNTKSPLNGEAARWVDQNMQRLPLDPVSLFVDDAKQSSAAPPQPAKAVVATAVPVAKAVKVPAQNPAQPPTAAPVAKPVAAPMATPPKPPEKAAPVAMPVKTPEQKPAQPPKAASAPAPAVPPETQPALVVECSGCKTRYRASAQARGKWLRCKRCQTLIAVPPEASDR